MATCRRRGIGYHRRKKKKKKREKKKSNNTNKEWVGEHQQISIPSPCGVKSIEILKIEKPDASSFNPALSEVTKPVHNFFLNQKINNQKGK